MALCILTVGCGSGKLSDEDANGVTQQEQSNEDESNTDNQEDNDYTLKFGKLLEVNGHDDVLVIKAKIEPSYNNGATIKQNGYNVEDLILNQGCDEFSEIQYWAVADMTDGSESKVISFTLDKNLIDMIKGKNIVGNQIVDKALDVWILPSLQD